MAHKVAEFGEFKDSVTVECEDGVVFHIEKEQFLLIEAIAKKICKEEFDVREKEHKGRIRGTDIRHDQNGKGKSDTDNKNGVHQVDSENGDGPS